MLLLVVYFTVQCGVHRSLRCCTKGSFQKFSSRLGYCVQLTGPLERSCIHAYTGTIVQSPGVLKMYNRPRH